MIKCDLSVSKRYKRARNILSFWNTCKKFSGNAYKWEWKGQAGAFIKQFLIAIERIKILKAMYW